MRAICALPAKLEDVDLRLVGMLSDLRHWIATTIRARATGIVPMVIPELPKDTRPAGGQLSELQPAPKVDPHGPNGTAASVHDVHPDWAQPTIAAAAVTGPAAIPAQYTAISPAIGARQPTARATSAQPAAVEW
jgi:hypothetical protein